MPAGSTMPAGGGAAVGSGAVGRVGVGGVEGESPPQCAVAPIARVPQKSRTEVLRFKGHAP